MPIYRLGKAILFPPVEHAEQGIVAVGGDLRPERLLRAYAEAIFPWYGKDDPILWHSPDPRFVLTSDTFRVPRSLRKTMRAGRFRVTLDTCFSEVIAACAAVPRPGRPGGETWITPEMIQAYTKLHEMGFVHSAEAWLGEELAGGLYGVSLGAAFFGESMFAREDDASKVAFASLVEQLDRWEIHLIDCQVETSHLARFGAQAWPRRRYLEALKSALRRPTRRGAWRFDPPPAAR
jgi:leucyl/phenylalanyl-tRNA--protein transferase